MCVIYTRDYCTVAYDYSGYGAGIEMECNQAGPSERQTYRDIEAVYDWCCSGLGRYSPMKILSSSSSSSALPSRGIKPNNAPPNPNPDPNSFDPIESPLVRDPRAQLILYGQSVGSGPSVFLG